MKINFSVILNSFERQSRFSDLKKSLHCLVNQSCQPKEILLVNSGNKKFDICKFNIKKKMNIKIINCSKRTNISQAKNIGAKKAKFKYLAFLDDDDSWGNNYLKDTAKFIKKNNSSIILSDIYAKNNKKNSLFKKPNSNNFYDYIEYNIGAMGSNLVITKKKFLLVNGFDKRLITGEDKGIIIDLLLKKQKVFFQKNIVNYNLHTPGSITKQPLKVIQGYTAFYKKYKKIMTLKNKVHMLTRIFSYKKK
tara:strand:+ start:698 stop:1444 length:747 start_codon:yes stop_codon:yes gene_type:complete